MIYAHLILLKKFIEILETNFFRNAISFIEFDFFIYAMKAKFLKDNTSVADD